MSRVPTPIDRLAEQHLETIARLDPIAATLIGVAGHNDALTDHSPAGEQQLTEAARSTLRELATLPIADPTDAVTAASLRERLGLEIELAEAGRTVGALNVIESPLQAIRDVFDLTDHATPEQAADFASRLRAVPQAMQQATEGVRARLAGLGSDTEWPFPKRQVSECIDQAEQAGELVGRHLRALTAAHPGLIDPDRVGPRIGAAFADFAAFLKAEVAPVAVDGDGVGIDAYRLASRVFLGSSIDLADTYAWGQQRLAEIVAEQQQVVDRLYPGAGVAEAYARLDADPRYLLQGTEALREWMQSLSDAAVSALAGSHFDIPSELQRLECRIAPSESGGIYYTGPSEDLSRPGRMWWAVPAGMTEFRTWQETTTVYHEGVPGHHLQIGQATISPLNRWRRLASFTSGHGEGWALYAERLMTELGFLDDPGNLLGMLDSQRLRAARVVLDIGVHCGFEAPAELGGGSWDFEKAGQFLGTHSAMDPAVARFELHRYLGWPGQAPSYAVGQRVWEGLRDDYLRQRPGTSLREFHRDALALGGLGLDTLTTALSTD